MHGVCMCRLYYSLTAQEQPPQLSAGAEVALHRGYTEGGGGTRREESRKRWRERTRVGRVVGREGDEAQAD